MNIVSFKDLFKILFNRVDFLYYSREKSRVFFKNLKIIIFFDKKQVFQNTLFFKEKRKLKKNHEYFKTYYKIGFSPK